MAKKTIVVVVSSGDGDRIIFDGENLRVINKLDDTLVIMDGCKRELGVFRKWSYWRDLSETYKPSNDELMGFFRTKFGPIPVYRKTIKENPDLLKSTDFIECRNKK